MEAEQNFKPLPSFLQENLLTLLCFDDKSCSLLVSALKPGMFDSDIYKNISTHAIEHFLNFKEPAKKHISDYLDSYLNSDDDNESEMYKKVLTSLFLNKDEVNVDYCLNSLNKFIKQQTLKHSIITAAKYIKNGDLEAAEGAIEKAQKTQIDIFEPGILITDTTKSLNFFDTQTHSIEIGIKSFDKLGLGPAPGELFVILAPPNRGKTFAMVHFGKTASLMRKKVLHISLEMSEEKMAQRYAQAFFSYTKRKGEFVYTNFNLDEMGKLNGFKFETENRPSLEDDDARKDLENKFKLFNGRLKLYVKRFPTNNLTILGLENYLDVMERQYKYIPDLILVDYADLMKIDGNNLRIDTGIVYKELRRIAIERNTAIVTASQSNRLGEDSKIISLKHMAEDYSKAATADNIIAYCQTQAENRLGLARLFVAKARNEERELSVLISQCYKMGQFHINDVLLTDNYWNELETHSPEEQQESKPRRFVKK